MGPLLELARTPGVTIEAIKDLVQLYREERAYQAERAFNDAFARFQSECPPIVHDEKAAFATKSGARVNYTYASLAKIASHVGPYLHKHGLSFSWDMSMDNGSVTAKCFVRHIAGHARFSPFTCQVSKTELQSPAQAQKGAQTFAQRCSLISVLGLTTTDEDNDAAGIDESESITENQARDLAALGAEVGANMDKFLSFFGVQKASDLPAVQYRTAVRLLEEKRRAS
jgi:hypothetical protein